ncbi:hypothetical protein [Micromonospora sp. NPDC005979]
MSLIRNLAPPLAGSGTAMRDGRSRDPRLGVEIGRPGTGVGRAVEHGPPD